MGHTVSGMQGLCLPDPFFIAKYMKVWLKSVQAFYKILKTYVAVAESNLKFKLNHEQNSILKLSIHVHLLSLKKQVKVN